MEINAVIFPFPAVLQLCGRIAFGDGELCEPTMHFHPQFSPININIDNTSGMPVTIRHLRRRCLYTINTQQGLTSYAFGLHLLIPTVLSIIYRLRRIPISGSQFPTHRLRRIPFHGFPFPVPDLPSPTDSRLNKWDAGDAHAQPASLPINKHFLAITANISHLGEMTNFSV